MVRASLTMRGCGMAKVLVSAALALVIGGYIAHTAAQLLGSAVHAVAVVQAAGR